MLNDIILSSLVHLFALAGSKSNADAEKSEKLMNDYLVHHFGLRSTLSYFNLYKDLRSFYDMCPDVDTGEVAEKICSNLSGKIARDELELMLLRLMEFCAVTSSIPEPVERMFRQLASHFGVSDSLFGDYSNFVSERFGGNVLRQEFEGYGGFLKTLWLEESNRLIFTYKGTDAVLFDDMPLMPGVFQIWHNSGILKNSKGAPLYYSSVHRPYEKGGGEEIEYIGKDVNFRFPGSDFGVHDFSFTLHSGEMVAVMGGSGTGKTTLMSILNGSMRAQSGTLELNGHPLQEVKGLIGFVPQDDLLIEELTVYQNLYYTARLCFDTLSEQEIEEKIMRVLKELCLEHTKDMVVGSPLNKTISGGQRKRLNIALELIREPVVLFLDEPTSGLSSADTENVMGLLKAQTDKGRLVVVNIHQPSSDVYKLFDRLWLLDKGGYPVYDGNPISAVTYFKRAADYADAESGTCPVCGNVNPEIVLNIIEEKALDNSGMPSDVRKTTPAQWHEMYRSSRTEPELKGAPGAVPESGSRKPGAFKQFLIFLERTVKSKLTNTQYMLITLLEAPVLAIICGLLTHHSTPAGYTVMDNNNLVTYLFMAVIVAIFLGMSGSAEEIIKDRTLLKRERFLNLNYGSYIWSKIAFAACVSLLQTALFILVGNFIMGLRGMFLMWWAILFVSSLLSSLIGLILSQSLNSVVAIYISIPILLIPQILLCGLVVSFSDLNGNSTTDNVPVVGDVIPSRWAFEAIAVGTYCYNDYERPFFRMDKERYETLFYRESFIYELESQLSTLEDEILRGKTLDGSHMDVVRTNLPRLEAVCGIEYDGQWTIESLFDYLAEAKSALSAKGNALTLKKDRMLTDIIERRGSEEMEKLRNANCNIQLENTLTGALAEEPVELIDNVLVPRVGKVFLTPVSRNGRAPFYSSEKLLGSLRVPTLLFNMSVLLLMCVLLTAALLINIPEKLKNKIK